MLVMIVADKNVGNKLDDFIIHCQRFESLLTGIASRVSQPFYLGYRSYYSQTKASNMKEIGEMLIQ